MSSYALRCFDTLCEIQGSVRFFSKQEILRQGFLELHVLMLKTKVVEYAEYLNKST